MFFLLLCVVVCQTSGRGLNQLIKRCHVQFKLLFGDIFNVLMHFWLFPNCLEIFQTTELMVFVFLYRIAFEFFC